MRVFPSYGTSRLFAMAVAATTALLGAAFAHANSLPLFFQALDEDSAFLASGRQSQVVIRPDALSVLIASTNPKVSAGRLRDNVSLSETTEVRTFGMRWLGAKANARIEGTGSLSGKVHHLSGERKNWARNKATWSGVKVTGVYPGIDVIYYGNDQRLEYDFHVAPGAVPSDIMLELDGVDSLRVDSRGDLLIGAAGSEIRQHAPVIYQVCDGARVPVKGSYKIVGNNRVGFDIAQYQQDQTLVIDPVLEYGSYFGGNAGDISLSVRSGPDNSIYIAGQTLSRAFLFGSTSNSIQRSFRGGTSNGDAFVAKFDATGSNLVYFTYLGGSADDGATDVAVDPQGNAYVTGFTISPNFPLRNPIVPRIRGAKDPVLDVYRKDAFISAITADGSDLIYSTYWGGTASDLPSAIAVDASGAACIAGTTVSTNFPILNPIPGKHRYSGKNDAFVSKFSPDGQTCIFSSYIGGGRTDSAQGIACDSTGAFLLTGYTTSTTFPLTNAFQTRLNNTTNNMTTSDAWVAKFDGNGTLLLSSYLGVPGTDLGYRIAVDAANDAYITGYTLSKTFFNTLTNVPGITNSQKITFSNADAFLTKLTTGSPGTPQIAYSTVIGGWSSDVGWDVAVTPTGDAYVIGITSSYNFPTNNAFGALTRTNSGSLDLFLFGLNSAATSVIYSGYIGGASADYGYGIAVRPNNQVLITGRTVSRSFPTRNPAQSGRYGPNDAFIAILGLDDL